MHPLAGEMRVNRRLFNGICYPFIVFVSDTNNVIITSLLSTGVSPNSHVRLPTKWRPLLRVSEEDLDSFWIIF